MNIFTYVIIFTLLASLFSLIGGFILLANTKIAEKISHLLSPFAAGVLLGAAFFDLLPEAAHEVEHTVEEGGKEINIFLWTLIGILLFFVIERFIHWFHHHTSHEKDAVKPTIPLVIIGDSLHNFIDGIIIAATFLVSVPLGIVTTLAVAAHEIPQEIGDFGILISKGLRRKKIILVNIISSLLAVLGALLALSMGEALERYLPILLSLAAGFFIYISTSDLIPDIHHENRKGFALLETTLLFIGIVIVYIAISLTHADH